MGIVRIKSFRLRYGINCIFISLLLVGLVLIPLASLISTVFAAPTIVLTPKWTRSGLGTNWEGGLVIGDVTGDGVEDVVYAGGNTHQLAVLNGTNGATIATYSNGNRIGTFCQPQLYDIDNDGIFEILVPLYWEPGLAAVQYVGGTLQQMWVANIQRPPSGQPSEPTPSGSVMAKPVAGDIDHDGFLDIFLASQDVSPIGGYDGTIVRLDHNGVEVARNFAWRACSGGLSLADTDSDGVFELYQGDRDMDYSDGGYGKGEKSFWADNLTERWIRLDDLTSSQAPVIADVNGDGIKDIITGMYNVQWIFNSTNGEAIKKWTMSSSTGYRNDSLSVHYGTTVYDIDGDGHLELLCNDGDHDDDPFTDVFDLVTGVMDAQLSHNAFWNASLNIDRNGQPKGAWQGGDTKWSPLVADISPTNPGMEIISVPNGTLLDGGQSWNGAIMIWSSSYESLQNITRQPGTPPGTYSTARLGSQMAYPVVQDIDNDGLLELVTHASSGTVYAFDTVASAPSGNNRIRSEVTLFGECRLGVAEHTIMPWAPNYWTAPLVAPVNPGDNALAVPRSTTQLSFRLREHQGQSLTYSVTTAPNIGSTNGSISSSISSDWNTRTVSVSGLAYDTTYRWTVSASDGSKATTRTYTFRTELAPATGNTPPSQGIPTLVPENGSTTSTFECTAQSTTDPNGDEVTNMYRWTVNGNPVAQLFLPFDTRDETTAKDYSGNGNDAQVIGATWVQNGKVGGAYSFDGKDDAIIISDGGLGYYNNRTYTAYPNHEELGGYGNWDAVTVEAWVYLTENNYGSRIVGKIPGYALGFKSPPSAPNTLYAAVWPYTGAIAQDENNATTDRERSVSATSALQLNTWYHVAFTYRNGTGLKLYINGASVANSSAYTGPLSPTRGEPVYIGRLVEPFAGMIDEVRLYNYAQPPAQIYNRYMESKDGDSNSSLFLPIGIAASGDILGCDVIPTDSYAEGIIRSDSVTLLNAPPVASNLHMYPIRDRAYRLDNENLGAGYDYSDADGNAESGTQIRWYRNNVLQSAYNDLREVPAGSTSIGQTWYFTVLPRDSLGAVGGLQTSETVTIRDNAVPSTGTPTLDSMNGGTDYDDEDLVATAATTTDGDGDATTNIFHWTKGGVSQTNLQMPFDTEVPLVSGTNGVTRDYSGYGNNGAVNGSAWAQTGVVGGAFSFDGNDYITVQESGNTLAGNGSWSQISVEFWIRATGATTSIQTVVFKPNASYAPGASSSSYDVGYRVQYRYYADSYRVYWIVGNSTGTLSFDSRVYEGPDQWHHVVCTYQSGVGLKIYTDGQLRASLVGTGNINATLGGPLYVGGINSGVGDFVGQMDEARIYPKALSAAQIFQRYIETKDGLTASNTIVAQETAAGDNWVCQVIPNDSWIDGTARNSTSLHVDPVVGNSRPRIDWYSPANTSLTIGTGGSINFTQVSSDPDGNPLTYNWTLDSVQQVVTQNWTYLSAIAGMHTVRITVSDGSLSDAQEWSVNVTPNGTYNLVIGASAGGTTNPVPNTYPYLANTNVTVTAIPTAGYKLNYWLLNNSNYGSANPYTINMTNNYNLTAVFTIIQYNLVVGSTTGGTTNPVPGTYQYNANTNATVQAIPNGGFELGYWLLDDVDVGDTNPYKVTMNTNHNLTAVFVVPPANAYLVVRGADDSVWYRSFDGSSWSGWIGVGGQTYDTPAAAVLNGKLHIIVNGTDGGLWWGVVDLSDNSFSGWHGMSGQGTPTLTATDTELYLVVRGSDDVIWYRSYDGSVWSNWAGLGGQTYDTPAAAVLNGKLHVVVNGTDGGLWWGVVDLSDNSFSGWHGMSGLGVPTLTSTGSKLYLVVRGADDSVWYRSFDGSSWSGWIGVGGQTYDTPAAAVLNGKLHIIVNGTDGGLWWGVVDLSDNSFSGWQGISGHGTPTMMATGNEIYLVVRGTDNVIWYRSYDGSVWSGWIGLGGLTYDTPAAAVLNGRLHIVVNGTDGALWWSSVNLTDNSFSGWQGISGYGTPTMTAIDSEVYLVVRGTDNGIWYRSYDGSTWTNWIGLGGQTYDTPAATVLNGRLHIVVNGTDGSLWWSSVNLTDNSFSGWQGISGKGTPTLTCRSYS